MLLFIVAITLCTVLWFFWHVNNQKKGIPPLPPGPRGLPVIGYLPFLGNGHLHRTFDQLASVYGPIYKFWLGNKLCVVVSSPLVAKEVVRDKDAIFANRDVSTASRIITLGGNDIAWLDYGPKWKTLRKIFVREMMSNANLDASYALRRQEVRKVIRDVYSKIGKPIEMGELAFAASINTVLRMIGGGTIQGEKWANFVASIRELAAEVMVLLGKPNVSDFFPILARFDLQGIERQTRKVTQSLEGFLDYAIEQYTNSPTAGEDEAEKAEKKKDFLQILLDLSKHGDSTTADSFTKINLKALLMDVVIGGTDTTNTTIEWAMAELISHQDIMEKVCEELEDVVGLDSIVEEFHLPKLHYLQAVVKETLRLHPALPFLVPRLSTQSTIVGGYTIPKGTTVFLNVYGIHRDPHLWENPLEFRPDRFLNDSTASFDFQGNNFQYLPFGSGRRVCAGIPLAEKMLMYVLASLLHSFEWELPQGTELELSDKFGIVVKKLKPLVLIPHQKLSDSDLY